MKRKISLLLALVLSVGIVQSLSLADNATNGEILQEMGLLKGDSDGNLKEDSNITRAEMMVILARLGKVEEEAKNYDSSTEFTDVSGWATSYISCATNMGWTSGTTDTIFSPKDNVTNVQAAYE